MQACCDKDRDNQAGEEEGKLTRPPKVGALPKVTHSPATTRKVVARRNTLHQTSPVTPAAGQASSHQLLVRHAASLLLGGPRKERPDISGHAGMGLSSTCRARASLQVQLCLVRCLAYEQQRDVSGTSVPSSLAHCVAQQGMSPVHGHGQKTKGGDPRHHVQPPEES